MLFRSWGKDVEARSNIFDTNTSPKIKKIPVDNISSASLELSCIADETNVQPRTVEGDRWSAKELSTAWRLEEIALRSFLWLCLACGNRAGNANRLRGIQLELGPNSVNIEWRWRKVRRHRSERDTREYLFA